MIVSCGSKRLRSLEPFRGLPVDGLDVAATGISDLAPLQGMKLDWLNISSNKIADLSPLSGMRLRTLTMINITVSDISVLKGMPLEYLAINGNPISNLEPIIGAPIAELTVSGGSVTVDYTPILELKSLARLRIAPPSTLLPDSLQPLRKSKSLQTIYATAFPGEMHDAPRPATEFWRAYDDWKAKRSE